VRIERDCIGYPCLLRIYVFQQNNRRDPSEGYPAQVAPIQVRTLGSCHLRLAQSWHSPFLETNAYKLLLTRQSLRISLHGSCIAVSVHRELFLNVSLKARSRRLYILVRGWDTDSSYEMSPSTDLGQVPKMQHQSSSTRAPGLRWSSPGVPQCSLSFHRGSRTCVAVAKELATVHSP